jgi:hypothetical protein
MVQSRDFENFLAAAVSATRRLREDLTAATESALVAGGCWHPTGFMIVQLEDIAGLGLARLHVWPPRARVAQPGHPMIHRHGFHLYSTVIHGRYSEVRYGVDRVEASSSDLKQALHGYTVCPPRPDNVDRILEEARWRYLVRPLGERTKEAPGAVHIQEAGIYHSTAIPAWSSCVTLAITSRHVEGQEDHLVGRPGTFVLEGPRPAVTPSETRRLLELTGLDWRDWPAGVTKRSTSTQS